METRRRPIGYIVIGVIAVVLIGWLTARYLVKRQLLRNLGTNDMLVRVESARKLLQMKKLEDSLPAQPIIRRSKTAEALGEIGTEEAIRVLGVILRDQEDAPRRWARRALVKQGKRAIPVLMAALSAGGGTGDEAVAALQEIGAQAPPKLRFLLSLGSAQGGAAEVLAAGSPVGLHALLRGCYNPDNDLRKAALGNLGGEEIREAVQPALDNVNNPPHGSVKTAAIKALGLIGDRRAVPDLIPRLVERDFREAAVTSLGQIGDPRAVEPILATMTETEKRYRNAAIIALGPSRIGIPAFPALVRELRSPEVLVRRAAAKALVVPETQELTPELVAALRSIAPAVAAALSDPDRGVRAGAAAALGWEGNVDAIAPLVGALTDSDWRVVDAAVDAAGVIGINAIGRLLDVLRDPGRGLDVRYQVARSLAAMGRPAVKQLVAALSGPDPEVQKWSAVALGEIGDQRAVEALEKLEHRATGDLKWVASEQLRRLRGIVGS